MKILILSSGGDAPGMNKFIGRLYRTFKDDLYFAYAGFTGLVDGQFYKVGEVYQKYLENEAGTMIKSSRCPEFKQKNVFEIGLNNAKNFDVVIILGGNGSNKGAEQLYKNNCNTIFVPSTIDNDVLESFYSIGFSTAVKEAIYTINNTMPSIQAFNNACVFEVMGRESDAICNEVAKNVKADYVINNIHALNFEKIKNVILKRYLQNQSAIIVVRENLMLISQIAEKLNSILQINMVKTQIVGRTQRGGKPTKEELLMANNFAKETIRCIKSKIFGVRILADKNKKIIVKDFK